MSLLRRPLAVVFDLDGTLIDSEALVREAYFATCTDFAITMTDTQFLSLVGMHKEANDASLRGFYGADFPVDRFREAARAFVGERAAPLKPGAVELIEALAEMRAPLGLATSSQRPWVERHFIAHKLTERFAAVVTRQDCVNGKPDPEPYLKAAAALGVAPGDALAIEDSHVGVRSAHAAGCVTLIVPDLLPADDEMRTKARVVASLLDVVTLLA